MIFVLEGEREIKGIYNERNSYGEAAVIVAPLLLKVTKRVIEKGVTYIHTVVQDLSTALRFLSNSSTSN